MNWLVFHPHELDAEGMLRLADRRARHLCRTVRVKRGDVVHVAQLGGGRGHAEVLDVGRDRVHLCCRMDEPPLPVWRVVVWVAMPRPKVARRLWMHLAALGVEEIWITGGDGVEPSYLDSRALSADDLNRCLLEGLEQSGGTHLPRVVVERRWSRDWLSRQLSLRPDYDRWVADTDGRAARCCVPRQGLVLAVGPERGWSARERQWLRDEGFRTLWLGPRTLRTDAACLMALGVVSVVWPIPGAFASTCEL